MLGSHATKRVTEVCCATCAYWCGEREIEFRANKPFYVNARSGSFTCMANSGRTVNSVQRCLRWQQWEKL